MGTYWLISKHSCCAQYALQWLWENENVLFKLFSKQILGIDHSVSKSLLCNGYRHCKQFQKKVFPPHVREMIDSVFANRFLMAHLSQPLRGEIGFLIEKRGFELRSHLERRISYLPKWTQSDIIVQRVSETTGRSLIGYFTRDWEKHEMDLISVDDMPFCKAIPDKFVVLNPSAQMTYVYDRSGEKRILVGMLFKEAIWRSAEKDYIRFLMSQLMMAHNEIKRQSCVVLDGAMFAYGPHFHTWEKLGGKKISFYKPKAQVKRIFLQMGLDINFAEFVDRHAHSKLVNIIFGIFATYCSIALWSFLAYSDPYFSMDAFESSPLEADFGGHGSCAYQLFVTQDYASEYHVDNDATDFTLAYASHPDASKTYHVDFHLTEVGLRFAIGDGDAYIFRTDYGHAIAYRHPSANAAYIGCVTVNSNLCNLMRRRQQV